MGTKSALSTRKNPISKANDVHLNKACIYLSLFLLISWTNCQTINMLSQVTQVGSGLPTTLDGQPKYPSHYKGTSGKGYVFSAYTQPGVDGPSFWIYSDEGTGRLLGVFDGSGFSFVRASVLTDPRKLFAYASGGTTTAQEHTLSYDSSSGLYTQITWTTNSAFLNQKCLIYEAGTTNYLYYTQDLTTSGILHKWDIVLATSLPNTAPAPYELSYSSVFYGGCVLLFFQATTYIEFVDRASMTVAKTLTGSEASKQFTVDNLDNLIMFMLDVRSPYGLKKLIMSMTSYGVTATVPGQGDFEYSDILNFGPYQYIGLFRYNEANRPLRAYSKVSLVEAAPSVYTPFSLSTYADETLVQGPSEGNKFFLACALDNNPVYNFQSYYIQFDLCSSRPGGAGAANAICPSCPAGYYLNTVGIANNECYPEGWGLNKDTSALVPCADSACQTCAVSDVCQSCSQLSSRPYLLNSKCIDLPTIGKKQGINPKREVVPCADSNCVNCTNNYQICTECDQANGLTLSGTVCVEDTIRTIYVVNTRFDPRQLIAAVEFNTRIEMIPKIPLNVSVIELGTYVVRSCEDLKCRIIP